MSFQAFRSTGPRSQMVYGASEVAGFNIWRLLIGL